VRARVLATIIVVAVFATGCPSQQPQVPVSPDQGTRTPPTDFYRQARERREQKELNRDLRDIKSNTSKP
jgi:hypothetical protein